MKLFTQQFFLLIIIFLLSSCIVGPNYKRPTTALAGVYSSDIDINNMGYQHIHVNQTVSSTWWKEFHSLELNNIIQLGITNNYTLISMREKLAQAQEIVNATSGQLAPQISLDGIAGKQKYGAALFGPINMTIQPFSYYEIGPNFNLLLDVFGGTRRAIEKQQALANYQNYEFNASFLSLTGNIATTALTIATINKQIATINEIIRDDQENVELVQKGFQLGASTKVDVLIAQSQLTNDKTLMPPLYQQLSVSRAELTALIGNTPANWQSPYFELQDFTLPKELPFVVPSELIHARPDILAAESLLHAACANIGIATANLYPSINLSGAILQESLLPSNLFNVSSNAWSFSSNLTTPLLNGGTLQAERLSAIHAYNAALANYQQVIINAFVQVNNILHALINDKHEIDLQQNAYKVAKDSLVLSRLSYQAGNVGVLQVIDAERSYNQARLAYTQAKALQYKDTVQLYLVLGGGVIPLQ